MRPRALAALRLRLQRSDEQLRERAACVANATTKLSEKSSAADAPWSRRFEPDALRDDRVLLTSR